MEVLDIALHPMVRCCDVPDALRLSGLQNTFSPAPVGRIRRSAASGNVPPCCLMRCAYQVYKIRSARP
ncbi:hypothetical protein, partial [Citrobacter portucalensis]|uniref:hypothetical protein n=1 Tax=Citrobacter portucalensis TaxID=1639133 RepID=UPI001C12CB22